jgi:Domain of unknown function (DUF5666)
MSRTDPTSNPPESAAPRTDPSGSDPSGTGPSGTGPSGSGPSGAGPSVHGVPTTSEVPSVDAGEHVTERIVIPSRPGGLSVQPGGSVQPSGSGQYGPVRSSDGAATRSGSDQLAGLPFDPASESEDWPARGPAKGIRINWLTALLLVLLIGGGGIWGGAALQRSQGSSTSSLASSIASRFAGLRGSGSGGSGTGSGGASRFGGLGSSAAATGTVTEVQGSKLYVTNASGNLVEVDLTPSTTVTRDAKTKSSALEPGDTVVVDGTTAKNGTVTASSVSATAQGVTGAGGFGF